jgi:hypothetical protein
MRGIQFTTLYKAITLLRWKLAAGRRDATLTMGV